MKQSLSIFLVLLVTACNQNPYPEDIKFGSREQAHPTVVPTVKPEANPNEITFGPNYFVRYDGDLELKEGVASKITFSAYMPSNNPDLEISDLPQGAIYNKKDMTFEWTPGFTAGNSATDPTVDRVLYKIKIRLKDLSSPALFLEQIMTLRVSNVSRANKYSYTASSTFFENDSFSQVIDITGVEFNEKDISPVMVGFPLGTTLQRISDSKVKISFTPGIGFISNQDSVSGVVGFSKKIDALIQMTNPRGGVENLPFSWIIQDRRVKPQLTTPDVIKGFEEARFSVSAIDSNAESLPVIRMLSRPPVGRVTMDPAVLTGNPYYTGVNIKWSDIPTQNFEKQYSFMFEACANPDSAGGTVCATKSVTIVIENNLHRLPQFKRDAWPFGTVMNLGQSQSKGFIIQALDGDTLSALDSLDVTVSSPKVKVSYKTGLLTVDTTEAGIYQINLKATSIFGLTTSEAFILQVNAPGLVAPVINRVDFPFGNLLDVKIGVVSTVKLPIKEMNAGGTVRVQLLVSGAASLDARWTSDELTLNGLKEGVYQIDLVATSSFGPESRESFVVRVSQ